MDSHHEPYPARLTTTLGDIARRGLTGRLLLAEGRPEEAGSLEFSAGRATRLHPGGKQPPIDLRLAGAAAARAAVARAAAAAASLGAPPRFVASQAAAAPEPATHPLTAGDLAIEVSRLIEDPLWLKTALGGRTGPPLAPAAEPPIAPPRSALGPSEGFLLSRADGSLNLGSILDIAPLGEIDALRALFALNAVGLLEQATPVEIRGVRGRSLSDLDRFLERTSAGPPKPDSPAAGADPGWSAQEQAERSALQERCRAVVSQDRYAILEVDRGANDEIIRQSYYRLARLYHPDRLLKPHLMDIHHDLEGMFAAITDAYNTLSEPAARGEYDRELHGRAGGRHSASLDKAGVAKEAFQRGRKAMEAGNTYEAIRLFETAVASDPSRADYYHHLGAAQGQNPRWRKSAEENLKKAIAMNPGAVASYLALARLYHKGGLERKAVEMYEQLLKWDPGNEEALAATGKKEGGAEGTGILRSLFRKD